MTSTRAPFATRRLARGIPAAAAFFLLAGPAAAQNTGNISMSAGTDVVTQYYFRGIVQETSGFIMQPYLDASISFGAASITAGTWSSLHSAGATGFSGAPESFYETDFYAGIGGAAGPVGLDATYTAYMSPRGSWGTVKELAIGLSVDNVAAPYATVAFELSGNAAGDSGGTYVELGIEPSAPLDDAPVSLSFPVAVGLSASDYYNPGGVNHAFGFFSAGASIGVPLNVPAEYGEWGLGLGVNALVFGEGLKQINGEDGPKIIALFGLSLGY